MDAIAAFPGSQVQTPVLKINKPVAFSFSFHSTEPPVIQTQPGALDVIVNNPILLPCEVSGTPRPIITWQKEGINIITTGILLKLGAPAYLFPLIFPFLNIQNYI